MFSWGGCVIKLLISIAVACATGAEQQNIGARIVMGVLVYSIISAWWYCCCKMGNYIIGTIVFIGVVFLATYGISAAPNIVLKVISYIAIIAIALGGVIADIWGMIQSVRYRV
ncbi:MAG: hypothetical protein NC543_12705 [bacterium]|nr:hypothetical protein [bacterium]MCM1374747.1 hypothetical protein [Muribaculum sp.]